MNRQQRRSMKKRQGENFADVLTKQRMAKEAVEKTARDTSVAIEADIKAQRFMWMAVVALNRAFGFGGERSKRFLLALEEVANDTEQLAKKHGGIYARQKLMDEASKITGIEIKPIYEDDLIRARKETEAAGIKLPESDPDKW